MNRLRTTALGALLAVGATGMPLAHSALAAHKVHTKTTVAQTTGTKTTTKHNGTSLVAYVASVVGVTAAVLQADLATGQTLLQIAGSKYANADALATALLAPIKTALNTATSGNMLSATQASTLYTQAHARVVTLVVTPHPALGRILAGIHAARTHTNGMAGLLSTFTATCNTTTAALKAAISTGGKSLLAICQSTAPAVTQDSLVAALLAPIKSKLDAAVSTNTVTSAQETTLLSSARTYLITLITTLIPAGGLHLHP